jgi:hypothetical protein
VVSDGALRERVLASQDAALERLLARDFGGVLLGYVERALGGRRRATAAVTFDFWDQVGQAEQLEELRLYRPAAYQALPKQQGTGNRAQGTGDQDHRTGTEVAHGTGVGHTNTEPAGR